MSQTDKDWQIAALKRRAAHAEEQVQYFNKAGQHWARNLGTAEVLLREIIDFYGDFPINDGVDATFQTASSGAYRDSGTAPHPKKTNSGPDPSLASQRV
jgi:hypothetical protein